LTFLSLNDIIKSTHAIDAKGGRLPIGIPGRLQIGMHGRLRRYPQPFEPDGPKIHRRVAGTPHERLLTFMGNRAPGRTSMTVVARELGLKPDAKKDLQKNLRNENHRTTMALKTIGVTYAVTGKGRGGKSELEGSVTRPRPHTGFPREPACGLFLGYAFTNRSCPLGTQERSKADLPISTRWANYGHATRADL
jgi:hypothetical protein